MVVIMDGRIDAPFPLTFSFLIPFQSIGHKSMPPSNFRPTRNVSHKFGWMYLAVTKAIKTMDNKLATDIVTFSICFTFNLNNSNFHPKDYFHWLTTNKRQQQTRTNDNKMEKMCSNSWKIVIRLNRCLHEFTSNSLASEREGKIERSTSTIIH